MNPKKKIVIKREDVPGYKRRYRVYLKIKKELQPIGWLDLFGDTYVSESTLQYRTIQEARKDYNRFHGII